MNLIWRPRMANILVRLILSLSLAWLLSPPRAAAAEAQVVNLNKWVPVAFTAVTCTGEPLYVSGKAHVVWHVTEDPAGGLHVVSKTNQQLVGIGLVSGDQFQGSVNYNASFYTRGGAPITYTVTNRFSLTGRGTASNGMFFARFHITVSANGEVTASVDEVRGDCKTQGPQ